MISENKLKILDDCINTLTDKRLKNTLISMKPFLNYIDEKLYIKVSEHNLGSSDIIIGLYNNPPDELFLVVVSTRPYGNENKAHTYYITDKIYNNYKQQLRLKKINNINKDVI